MESKDDGMVWMFQLRYRCRGIDMVAGNLRRWWRWWEQQR